MRILVTNDDGIQAKGLLKLCETLNQIAEVVVIAPSCQQSATGHGITVGTPIYLRRVNLPVKVEDAWSVDGFPADCTKLGVEQIYCDKEIDLVVSGINHGPNTGTDALYSGTVAAALEGFFYDIPAIAVSVIDEGEYVNFKYAAEFTKELVIWWFEKKFQPLTMLNVNIPNLPKEQIKGVDFSFMGIRKYINAFRKGESIGDDICYIMGGQPVDDDHDPESDVAKSLAGYITITPLGDNLTNYHVLRQLKNLDKPNL